MDDKKIGKALALLHDKSINYQLDWTEVKKYVYQVSFSNSSVLVGQYEDREMGNEPYTAVRFYNNSGNLVFEIHGGNISNYLKQPPVFLEEIYNAAREHILNADNTVDDIIRSLSPVKEDDIPF